MVCSISMLSPCCNGTAMQVWILFFGIAQQTENGLFQQCNGGPGHAAPRMKSPPRRQHGCSMLRKVLLLLALLFSGVVFVLSRHIDLNVKTAADNGNAHVHSHVAADVRPG